MFKYLSSVQPQLLVDNFDVASRDLVKTKKYTRKEVLLC